MSGKLSFERYHWFHGQVKAGRLPNATHLADRFEISRKQAQREIRFMRERIGAPLDYNHAGRGYLYSDPSYELSTLWFNESELLSLCIALRLSATLPDTTLKSSLTGLLEKIVAFRFAGSSQPLQQVQEKVSVKNIQYYRVDEDIFRRMVGALFNDEPVSITYYTPHKDETTERTVLPLHLLCYMGSWHLIAYCALREGVRDFSLSRIGKVESASQTIELPETIPSIKECLRENFGLMSGAESVEVRLQFTPEISNWIGEQVWHAAQEITRNSDGSLCITFPVADFREVRREILKFGASVEVLSPQKLRQEIAREIKKMQKIYR